MVGNGARNVDFAEAKKLENGKCAMYNIISIQPTNKIIWQGLSDNLKNNFDEIC